MPKNPWAGPLADDVAPLGRELEQKLADLDDEAWHALCGRVRPPESNPDPKVQAALAMRELRGADRRGAGQRIDAGNPAASSKEAAAEAIRVAMGKGRVTDERGDEL